ncbi:MAG: glycosyltransferase family 2 protein [Candidatus Heimdallarchaeaceae archaeon]
MNIHALIPAHNEEEVIAETIRSLKNQTIQLQKIVVIADNCTDGTKRIAELEGVEVFVTTNNKNKKAGAYNQYLKKIEDSNVDLLVLMDADTVLAEDAVEIGVKHFDDNLVAAVCSKAGVQKLKSYKRFSENILHRLQKIEYGLYDSQRVETAGYIKVVHGMAAIHRWRYIQEVGYFNEESITEDYYLTLKYKTKGYKVIPEIKMKAWTVVPTKLRDLYNQRLRWYRGGIDSLISIGWNRGTYKDILQHIWVNILTLLLSIIYISWITYAVKTSNYSFHYHWFIVLIILFCIYDRVYRIAKYCENIQFVDWLIILTIIPEIVYNQLQTIILYIAYLKTLIRAKKIW